MKEEEEAPYCLGCPTHKAIRNYSKTRFAAVARDASAQLEQFKVTGIFGDDYKHQTLWDENGTQLIPRTPGRITSRGFTLH